MASHRLLLAVVSLSGFMALSVSPSSACFLGIDCPFGTAPAAPKIGKTTGGPLKVAPRMSNAGDPIRVVGKPAATRVMSNAGQPVKTVGASGFSLTTYGYAKERRAAVEKADALQLRKQADREAKNGNDVAAAADRSRAKVELQSAKADQKIGQNLIKIAQPKH